MAAQPRSLAETSITLREFARCLSKHVVTVRKWFENDKAVIRTPRGGQRDQILIPISHALTRCRAMGIPEDLLQAMVEDHQAQLRRAAERAAASATPALVPAVRVTETKEPARNKKTAKTKKQVRARSKSRAKSQR